MAANHNHPKEGSFTKVGPFTPDQMKTIVKYLERKTRDQTIFVTGCQTNLRAGDLLKLSVGDAKRALKTGYFELWEKKTKKWRKIKITTDIAHCLKKLLETMKGAGEEQPLFANSRTGKALTVPTLNNMVKEWAAIHGFTDRNYGSHSLRKTFGYIHRIVFGTSLYKLMKMFNHASEAQTLEYLCMSDEEIDAAYDQFNGFCELS